MPHVATVHIKDQRDRSKILGVGLMDDEVWDRPRADWLSWLESGTPKGGAYPYVSHEGGRAKVPGEFLLRFDEVKAVS